MIHKHISDDRTDVSVSAAVPTNGLAMIPGQGGRPASEDASVAAAGDEHAGCETDRLQPLETGT